jgi:hypothetical protein
VACQVGCKFLLEVRWAQLWGLLVGKGDCMSLLVVRWAVGLLVVKENCMSLLVVRWAVGLLVDAGVPTYRSGSADGASVPENEFFGRSGTVIFTATAK